MTAANEPVITERRSAPRVNKTLPLKLTHNDYDILTETKNISANGAYFSSSQPLELMTKLNVVLLIPLKKTRTKIIQKINCCGVIVRQERTKENDPKFPYRIAMYFSELKDQDKKVLNCYVNSILKTPSYCP